MASQGGTSRLAQMQMRFQQKQQEEREQRKIEMTGDKTITQTTEAKSLSSTMGTGKVRQMFDERRQRGTGIDKSYPLKPIASRTSSGPSTTVTTTKATSSTVGRKQQSTSTVIKQTNSRTSSSETTLVTKKTNVLNGNAVVPSKGKVSVRATGDNMVSPNHDNKLPNMEKLSLVDNKNVNGYASGDKNNNTSSNSSTIKLKPVLTKKVAPEPKLLRRTEESSLSSSSSRLLSPASDRSSPTSSSMKANKTNAKPTSTSETRMAAATQRAPPQSTPPENMAACRICQRHFNVDRIEKHQEICEKAAIKKRKVFDASKHRVKGTEAEQYVRRVIKSSAAKAAPKKAVEAAKKSSWRKKHEEFIQAIRAAKEMQAHLARGGKLSDLPPPPPSENPDYIQCPHCKRRFNEAAATRHIPKCADMLHNKPKPGAPQKRGAKR